MPSDIRSFFGGGVGGNAQAKSKSKIVQNEESNHGSMTSKKSISKARAAKASSPSKPAPVTRMSPRTKKITSRPQYVIDDDDDAFLDDVDADDDIFVANYKKRGRQNGDDYEESSSEEDVKPLVRRT